MKKKIMGLIAVVTIIMMMWYCNNAEEYGDDVCPNCKSDSIKEMVVYGLLTAEEKANPDSFYNVMREQGKVYGGCVVGSRGPRFYCYNCGHRW